MLVEEDKPVAYGEPALIERNITMSNALTRVAHSLALAEERLIATCITKNNSVPFAKLRREGTWRVRLSAVKYIEAFGVDANTAYGQLQGTNDSLFNHYMRTVREARRGPEEFKFRWASSARYHEDESRIELAWFREMVPHLLGLRREFTTCKPRQTTILRSTHARHLFERFKS